MAEQRMDISGIPARLYRPSNAAAVLLFGHGGGHSKDSPRFEHLARRYADETGLAVVCIDAVDHGERQPTQAGGGIPSGWHSRSIDRMVEDWKATAAALEAIGPTIAYVGFSMGAIFGFPTVAAMPSIQAAVFVAGGIPTGGGIDDPGLGPRIFDAASTIDTCQVLMLNKTDDEIFLTDDVQAVFEAVPGTAKELLFWEGEHDQWPSDLIAYSVAFLQQHLQAG
jgi:dienelactone hydrolase